MDALIRLLQQDSTVSHADLARMLDMSEAAVDKEIARLEASGLIIGYQAIVNREKWEPDTVTAMIEVRLTPERAGGFDRLAARIAKFEEVRSCYLVSGGYDLLLVVEGQTLREVATFVAEKLSPMGAVQASATHFRLKTYKENGTYHALEETPERLSVTP
ncbi:MAG: Lrp/AsnC family transcriptional regulator [Chthoniobacterales bacterium]